MPIHHFFYSEKKKKSSSPTITAKPKKKFLLSDLRNMHNILSKNMYKIRQRVRITPLPAVALVFHSEIFLLFILTFKPFGVTLI